MSRPRFVGSLFVAVVAAGALALFVVEVHQVGALTFAGVGGFNIEIDTMIGNEFDAYPFPTSTAACQATFDDPRVGDSSESGLVALKADLEQLRVPASSDMTMTKDIRMPAVPGVDAVRIALDRGGVEQNPDYPPVATPGPVSEGRKPGALIDEVRTAGIAVDTGSNDGYSDLRFQRTRNVTGGESVAIEVEAEADYGYGEHADPARYRTPGALNPDRYVDGVTLQGLANTGTGDDGGYAAFPTHDNSFPGATTPAGNLTRNTAIATTVDAVAAPPDFSAPTPPNTPTGDDAGATIASVTTAGISTNDPGTAGYVDYTDDPAGTSDVLSKGGSVTLSVAGDKIGGPSDFFEATSPGDPGLRNDPGYELVNLSRWPGVSDVNVEGDGRFTDYTDYSNHGVSVPDVVSPGSTFDVAAAAKATGDERCTFIIACDDVPGLTLVKLFVDWDQDDTTGPQGYEAEYIMGLTLSQTNDVTVTELHSRPIKVPDDAPAGTTDMRLMTNAAVNQSLDAGFGPTENTGANCPGEGDPGCADIADFSVHVTPRSQVSAFVDWDHDGTAETETTVVDVLDKADGYSRSVTLDVPPDAKSGATRMRIVHQNDANLITTEPTDFDGEVQDYTLQVADEHTNASVTAHVDWDHDEDFDRPAESQRIDTAVAPTGPWTADGGLTAPAYARAGPTVMRVVHQQDGYDFTRRSFPAPPPNATTIDGEYEDYTVYVEPSASFVRAWVDWDGSDTMEAGELAVDTGAIGSGDPDQSITVSDTLQAPASVPSDVVLLRVTHRQAPAALGPPAFDAGERTFVGETLDFTAVTGPPGDISDDGNMTLGDVSFVTTGLDADRMSLQGDVLLEESHTDNTVQSPKFGPRGEFNLGGESVRMVNVSGVVHLVTFSYLSLPEPSIDVRYDPPDPKHAGPGSNSGTGCDPYP